MIERDISLAWLRRDLRLSDQAAFSQGAITRPPWWNTSCSAKKARLNQFVWVIRRSGGADPSLFCPAYTVRCG